MEDALARYVSQEDGTYKLDVLILVLMEDALAHAIGRISAKVGHVLILVLMEDALAPSGMQTQQVVC